MKIYFLGIFLLVFFSFGCQKDLDEQEKYQRPEWLSGKLYTQLETQDDLQLFRECVEKTIYDSILNISGSFTVFAPTDEAMNAFLSSNQYSSVNDIPQDELLDLVESHIIQNAWTRTQIRTVNTDGWIDDRSEESRDNQIFVPRAFKKQTLYRDKNERYFVKRDKFSEYDIVNEENATEYRIVFTPARKYMPLFFREYFETYKLVFKDYEFYFDRPFEDGIYYAEGKLLGNEIPAENGYIHRIDRVLTPLKNGGQLLEDGYQGHSYQHFLNLINEFPEFEENLVETYKQPGADEGKEVDMLYNMYFPELIFNVYSEITGPNPNVELNSIQYQNGLFAPDDQAFQRFVSSYVSTPDGWGSVSNLPPQIKIMIVNAHMTEEPVYESDLNSVVNGVNDSIVINKDNIIQKRYGSNCTFIGLDEAIVPKAFTSVSAPVYLNPKFSLYMYSIEATNVLSALKQEGDHSFFIISDISFGADSALSIEWERSGAFNQYSLNTWNRSTLRFNRLSDNALRLMLLNHIGITTPKGLANKEFIENLAGNYIVMDNGQNIISGSSPTTFGYNGDSTIYMQPMVLSERKNNGLPYEIDTWLSFTQTAMYTRISAQQRFFDLMKKAGLVEENYYRFNFLNRQSYNTVFIPSDSAIDASGIDTLSADELGEVIKYHFVGGELVFTDGSKPQGLYRTRTSIPSYLNIQPEPDNLKILDKDGNVYINIPESSKTNIMTTIDIDPSGTSPYDHVTTGVIHFIDKVLLKDSLDTGANN
ncbi:MAG: fasciclin domain-containing protein [bacterium]